jgi:hypothetical protein
MVPRRSSTELHSVRASLPTRQTSGKCLPEPADGVCPVPGKGREAERLCPRAGWRGRSTFGPHPTGTQRFATVSSGRSFAQVAGAILRKQVPGQNPDKDAVAPLLGTIAPRLPGRYGRYASVAGVRRRSR